MTNISFLFVLTPDAERSLLTRVAERMKQDFPQHEFFPSDVEDVEFQNVIIPLRGAGEAFTPGAEKVANRLEVLAVINAFRRTLHEVQEWKPS